MSVPASAWAALAAVLDEIHPGWEAAPEVVRRARELSEGYTEPGRERRTPTLDPLTRAAYLAYFGPRALQAVTAVASPVLAGFAPRRTLEVGAGSGASALALAGLGLSGELVLADRDASALASAQALLHRLRAPGLTVTTRSLTVAAQDPLGLTGLTADLGLMSFALAEMALAQPSDEDEVALLSQVVALAARCRRFVLVDAGDRPGARVLQQLRELALAEGLSVLAPCPHDEPCPALARRKDWCHSIVRRETPERFAALARAVGRDDERMALSYLVLAPAAEAPDRPPAGLRVIGEVRREKGRVRLPVCGPGGVRFLQALKRDHTLAEGLFALSRGEHLDVPRGEVRHELLHLEEAPRIREEKDGFP